MILAYQFNHKTKKCDQVGWAHKAQTYFKMMGWKIPDDIEKVNETKELYYCLHEPCGSYHWTKEDLLSELRKNGVIS